MKKLIGGLAVAFVAVFAVVALTGFRGGGCGGGHRHGRDPAQLAAFVTDRVDDALDDLDATPEQRARVHEVKERMLAAGKEAHAGHEEVRAALLAEWRSQAPDRARLHALVDARVEAMRKLAHEAVDAGAEVHGILTPEQREKVTKKVERWHR